MDGLCVCGLVGGQTGDAEVSWGGSGGVFGVQVGVEQQRNALKHTQTTHVHTNASSDTMRPRNAWKLVPMTYRTWPIHWKDSMSEIESHTVLFGPTRCVIP